MRGAVAQDERVPAVTDPTGTQWSIHRRWWPFRSGFPGGPTMSGDAAYGLVQLLVTLPFLLAWPIWLLSRIAGGPWTVVVGRAGRQVHVERVRGWAASGRRITELEAACAVGACLSRRCDTRPLRYRTAVLPEEDPCA